MNRITLNRVFVVLKQFHLVSGQWIKGVRVHAVGGAVAPAELNEQINANGGLQVRCVALVLVVEVAGGRIVVRIEEPMVVVSIGHTGRRILYRRRENTVHRHRQIQVTFVHPCLNTLDVAARIGHVGRIVHAGDLPDGNATVPGHRPYDGKRHQPQDAGCWDD
ncbi:hypothetical protein ES703_48598 [subsurface metagenome]